jgi:hypothetical protein
LSTPNRPIDLLAPTPPTDEQRAMISAERRKEIEKQVELELHNEQVKQAEEAFRAQKRRELREISVPEEMLMDCYIDLPPEQSLYLMTNGVMYVAGQTYRVTKNVYDDLRSRMWRAWWNESQRWNDTRENMYRNKLESQISSTGKARNGGWYDNQGFGAALR